MVDKEKPHIILGISAFYHDSAAAILVDGVIVAAAHEERFTREKHDAGFPHQAIQYCLKEAGVALADVTAVTFYDKPLLKFERLLETYMAFAPRGVRSFISAAIVWIKEKFLLRSLILRELKSLDDAVVPKLLFSDHHLSHAASAFYPSPFQSAAIVTIDGVGEWSTTTIGKGSGRIITPLKEIHFPHSIGLLYSAFTYYLGFKVNSGEYKLMGLAPYGNPDSADTKRFVALIKEHLIESFADGSFWLNQSYFNYATGLTMTVDHKWAALFKVVRKTEAEAITQIHCDLALAIQLVTEELVLKLLQTAKDLTGEDRVVLAGGVALNCVANRVAKEADIFSDIWVQPAAGDAGGALGAALATHYIYYESDRVVVTPDAMHGSYLGPAFDEYEIGHAIKQLGLQAKVVSSDTELFEHTAQLISEGNVVGWFQGRMEWGPRALGARSILGDPRNPEMQKKLNLRIKFREGFRPFAPSVLAEHADELLTDASRSPYMLFTTGIKPELQNELPAGYHDQELYEKLYFKRSSVPAVTHIDYSARHQTVHQDTNPRYHALIAAFYARTNCPAVINTSFNVRGEPIVCTPEDALRCLMNTDMDYLVIGNFVLDKTKQNTELAKQEFAAD